MKDIVIAKRVEQFFNERADDFDAIYTGRKSPLRRLLDRLLRWDMYERYRLTFEECDDVMGKTVLDVGCGSGRYAIEFARRGAARVVGVDFAEKMIDTAIELAEEWGVGDVCSFIKTDFLQHRFDERFELVLAIGLFDYIKTPEPMLRKMKALTSEKIIATFPVAWTYRMPIRKIRLGILGCPVYFYTRNRVEELLSEAGFCSLKIQRVGHIYFAVGMVR